MKITTTIILILICVVFGGTYWIISNNNKKNNSSVYLTGEKLFEDFPVNEVTKFTISDATNSIAIEKKDGIWIVDNYYDYPADFDKIVGLLEKIYDLKIGQIIRVRKESLGKLKLVEPSNSSASLSKKGIMLQFFGEGGLSVCRLLVGKVKHAKSENNAFGYIPSIGQYIIIPDEAITDLQGQRARDNVILIDNAFNLVLSPESWIKKNLLNVKTDKIKEIQITSPNGNKFIVCRTNKTDKLTLKNIKKDEKMKEGEIDNLASALNTFNIEKVVLPGLVSSNKVMENAWEYQAKTFGGTKYKIKISNTNEPKNYARISVDYEKPPVESIASNIAENVETSMGFEDAENARELSEMFAGRTYEISDYEAKKIRKSRNEIVEKEKKKEVSKQEASKKINN